MKIVKKSLLLTLVFSIIFGAASAHIISGAAFFSLFYHSEMANRCRRTLFYHIYVSFSGRGNAAAHKVEILHRQVSVGGDGFNR